MTDYVCWQLAGAPRARAYTLQRITSTLVLAGAMCEPPGLTDAEQPSSRHRIEETSIFYIFRSDFGKREPQIYVVNKNDMAI